MKFILRKTIFFVPLWRLNNIKRIIWYYEKDFYNNGACCHYADGSAEFMGAGRDNTRAAGSDGATDCDRATD